MVTLTFNIQPAKSTWTGGTIYIRADGSIDPPDAPITTYDNITYTLTDNITSYADGIVVEKSDIIIDGAGYTLQGAEVYESKGIDLSGRENVTVQNMQIKNFWYGILLYYSSNNSISGNNITANGYYGICLGSYSNYNSVAGNQITNNFQGLLLSQPSSSNIISGNIITNNTYNGIELYDSSNNSLFGNTVTNNQYGVWLHHYSDYNYIVKNTVTNNTVGIRLSESVSHNRISGNDILANSFGIELVAFAENNLVYHNNFINNTDQVDTYPWISNVWDSGYPSGGNYWSDYTGVDADGDGIGDIPYVIDENNTDRYPLMHPWSSLPVHNINTGLGYATIQEAINAPETLDGHTIFVEAGTYYENIVVNKTLTLIGENKDGTTIDGKGMGTVIDIVANNVIISGFTVQNSKVGIYNAGIRVFYYANVIIENNTLARNFVGAWLFGASNCTVHGNIIEYGDTSIRVDCSSNSVISGNSLTNSTYGIKVDWSSCIAVYRNNVTNCDYSGVGFYQTNDSYVENNFVIHTQNGISLDSSSNNTIAINNITNNCYGIRLYSSSNNSVSGNMFFNDGLYVWDSYGNVVLDNFVNGKPLVYLEGVSDFKVGDAGQVILINCNAITVEDLNLSNTTVGIQLWKTNNTKISGNNITNGDYGIGLDYSSNNSISGNNIKNNDYGIHLSSSSNNTISGNNITANNWDGVWLSYYSGNTFSGNSITANGWNGIELYNSSNNTFSGNNITANNGDGIYLYVSSNNTIIENNITNNGDDGVVLSYSSNYNTVFDNMFTNDGLIVWDSYLNVVEGNLVNGRPIVYLEDVSGYTVEEADQVILVNCDNIVVENLNLSNATVGIELWITNNTKIKNDNITGNVCGILLATSSNNTISGNNIANNDDGVCLGYSSNNIFYHNNFIDNTQQVYFFESGYTHVWDDGYPSGGNYWSDYTGSDLYSGPFQNETGSDGIGDTPYVIDENNIDHYPLMIPWAPKPPTPPYINATLDINPKALNLRSRGKWITAYIELPEGYTVQDINVSSIMLNDSIPVEPHPTAIGDYDDDGVPDLMVKFDRQAVIRYVLNNVDIVELFERRFMTVTLTITGYLNDGTQFQGNASIRIIMPMPRGIGRHIFIL